MSSVAPITSDQLKTAQEMVTATRSSTNATLEGKGQSTLGQKDFFSLLTTQLMNQNPLEPMKDTDFIAQMANFSSLEQMTTLNKSFGDFKEEQLGLAAQQYLGREVRLTNDKGKTVEGVVTEVTLTSKGTRLRVGDEEFPVDRVNRVRLSPN